MFDDIPNGGLALAYSIFVVLLISAAIFDMTLKIIPIWITVAIILVGVTVNILMFEKNGLWSWLLGLSVGFLIMLPGYVYLGVGGGDVKLIAAIGSVVGLDQVIDVIFYSINILLYISLVSIFLKGDLFKLAYRFAVFIKGLFRGVVDYQRPASTEAAAQELPIVPVIALATGYVLLPMMVHLNLLSTLCHSLN